MSSKEDRRLEIIKAAIKIFSRDGFHKAKIETIAKEAGVGKGTIYEYFESKKALFQEMIILGVERYREGIREIALKDDSIADKIRNLAHLHSKFLGKHIGMAQMVMSQSDIVPMEMKLWLMELRVEALNLIEEAIEEAIKRGELRAEIDIQVAALSIMGTLNQYCMKEIFYDKVSPKNINPEPVIDILLRGIGKECNEV